MGSILATPSPRGIPPHPARLCALAGSATRTEARLPHLGSESLPDFRAGLPRKGTGRERKEKGRRRGKRRGSARGTGRRSGRANHISLASVFSPLEHCIKHHHFGTYVYITQTPPVEPPLHPSLHLSFCIGRSIYPGLRSPVCSSGPASLSALLRRLSCQKSTKNFHVSPEAHKR